MTPLDEVLRSSRATKLDSSVEIDDFKAVVELFHCMDQAQYQFQATQWSRNISKTKIVNDGDDTETAVVFVVRVGGIVHEPFAPVQS